MLFGRSDLIIFQAGEEIACDYSNGWIAGTSPRDIMKMSMSLPRFCGAKATERGAGARIHVSALAEARKILRHGDTMI